MGHERVGVLPKTKRWQSIVGQIASSSRADFDVSALTRQTIQNVRQRFRNLQDDNATKAAFTFLVNLAVSSRPPDPHQLAQLLHTDPERVTPLQLAKALHLFISQAGGLPEYSAVAEGAAVDALALWYEHNRTKQQNLFDSFDSAYSVWHKAGNGPGFCELSRLFFGKMVERYLNYFLEREASRVTPTLQARNLFRERLELHLDDISRHAFETSKITQSYAAGWFNRYAAGGMPSEQEIERFISYAFGKLQDELIREAQDK